MSAPFPAGVLVVGTGLLGTSAALALRRAGVDVRLRDADPNAVGEALGLGAGRLEEADDPPASLAVVAVPPEATGVVVAALLDEGVAEYVTDVASVKALPATEVGERAADPSRYVGSHPMAGREVSGPSGAVADLFEGRPWVLCPDERTSSEAVERARTLAGLVGAVPITMPAPDHDAAVALVSHAPHLMAVLMAARLKDAPERDVRLAGPGVTDVTRVAGGDPALWTEILIANAPAVRTVLDAVLDDLEGVLATLDATDSDDARAALTELLSAGVAGRARLPGKRGAPPSQFATVTVVIADRPGELARLFAAVEAAGANVEDVRIEHRPGAPVGAIDIDVRPGIDAPLAAALRDGGWNLRDAAPR